MIGDWWDAHAIRFVIAAIFFGIVGLVFGVAWLMDMYEVRKQRKKRNWTKLP